MRLYQAGDTSIRENIKQIVESDIFTSVPATPNTPLYGFKNQLIQAIKAEEYDEEEEEEEDGKE